MVSPHHFSQRFYYRRLYTALIRLVPILGTFSMEQSPAKNIELLKEAVGYLNNADIKGCLHPMRPDFIINIAEMPYQKRGHKAWRNHAEYLFSALSGVQMRIDDIFATENKVAIRIRIKGVHTSEFLGVAGTGRRIEYVSHEIYRLEDGMLAEEWICSDNVTLLTQIGALSQNRLLTMWLAGYRFWFGAAMGAILAAVVFR